MNYNNLLREINKLMIIPYRVGEGVRKHLKKLGEHYKPKYTMEEHFAFLKRNHMHFGTEHPQSQDPYVYCLFTEVSQDVYGDSLEECLDKAIDIEKVGGLAQW